MKKKCFLKTFLTRFEKFPFWQEAICWLTGSFMSSSNRRRLYRTIHGRGLNQVGSFQFGNNSEKTNNKKQ